MTSPVPRPAPLILSLLSHLQFSQDLRKCIRVLLLHKVILLAFQLWLGEIALAEADAAHVVQPPYVDSAQALPARVLASPLGGAPENTEHRHNGRKQDRLEGMVGVVIRGKR